ncbi:hypothetical protein [Legionella longbeachae]|uniref:hypothetical protein n=1 Tax=Legionella longbeachae TaxID=450 RepID=UPI0001BEC06A|nr:hypothetical protein [Legionella longbeachae]EEZ94265.1 hypothetical protein LLB_3169 [Legionella longbeachae D-4968]HBD7398960.1 hypothetical protein [Legionella pneumophila]ARB93943.1 hypothetical protein A6J40_17920 [Legionella longbeachae]ARM32919.1 hypothetical protein B0B39_05030 [Legionella longbeachae]QIN32882.1 hypothetical protein GCB94_12400 [Legionella longbeachae]
MGFNRGEELLDPANKSQGGGIKIDSLSQQQQLQKKCMDLGYYTQYSHHLLSTYQIIIPYIVFNEI